MQDNGYYIGGQSNSEWIESDITARTLGVEDDSEYGADTHS